MKFEVSKIHSRVFEPGPQFFLNHKLCCGAPRVPAHNLWARLKVLIHIFKQVLLDITDWMIVSRVLQKFWQRYITNSLPKIRNHNPAITTMNPLPGYRLGEQLILLNRQINFFSAQNVCDRTFCFVLAFAWFLLILYALNKFSCIQLRQSWIGRSGTFGWIMSLCQKSTEKSGSSTVTDSRNLMRSKSWTHGEPCSSGCLSNQKKWLMHLVLDAWYMRNNLKCKLSTIYFDDWGITPALLLFMCNVLQ